MHDGGPEPGESEERAAFAALDVAFANATQRWRSTDDPVTILFSGGVDSGLLAWELREHPALTLLTAGVAGSPDLVAGESGARTLGLAWTGTELTEDEVRAVAERIASATDGLPWTTRTVLIAFEAAVERAPRGPILCGQGADELFLGYAHFRGLDATEARERSEADLRTLIERDWPTARTLALRTDRRVYAPYLEPEFVAAARAVPVLRRMPGEAPKRFFRRWAVHRGLPPAIANRPKRALQFGSGVGRVVARATRDRAR
jgi:asparagine synthase (glutamine-hydrolysing)